MGDTLIHFGLPPLAAICLYSSIKTTGRKINPVTIIFLCFFLPMYAATFRLSGVQSNSWTHDTYAAIWLIIASWLIVPTILLAARGKADARLQDSSPLKATFLPIYRSFAVVVFTAYLASNYIQAGTLLPILIPEAAYKLHTEFVPVLRVFARCIPAIVGLAYLAFVVNRRKIDLAVLALALLIPLTRLSRIDVALSLGVLACVFIALPIFRISGKRLLVLCLLAAAIVIGSVELGNQRTNRFGQYEVKYERAIQWKPSTSGPAGIYSVLYGYFPLSFENFDAYIRQTRSEKTLGLASFDWFFSGAIKFNRFGGALGGRSTSTAFEPVSSAANVPTALLPFYADFGVWGMIFPAAGYMMLWVFLFYRASRTPEYLVAYSVYSAAFSLAAFQALMVAPIIFHQIVIAIFLCFFARRTTKSLEARRRFKFVRPPSRTVAG